MRKLTMRTYILGALLTASSVSLHAAPVSVDTSAFGTDGDANLSAGFTFSGTSRLYNNPDTVIARIPYFTASKNGFYINGINVGYELTVDPDPYVAPKPSLRIDILGVPRFLGYKAEESPVLEGLDDTNYSVHAGLSFSLVNGPVNLNLQMLTDILNQSGGSELSGTISKTFSFNKLSLTPALNINWQDEALVDYYYGVNGSDATATRAQYSAGAVINTAVSLTAGYPISQKLNAFGAIKIDQFGSEITDSPIVDEDTTSAATFGLAYSF